MPYALLLMVVVAGVIAAAALAICQNNPCLAQVTKQVLV